MSWPVVGLSWCACRGGREDKKPDVGGEGDGAKGEDVKPAGTITLRVKDQAVRQCSVAVTALLLHRRGVLRCGSAAVARTAAAVGVAAKVRVGSHYGFGAHLGRCCCACGPASREQQPPDTRGMPARRGGSPLAWCLCWRLCVQGEAG